MGHPVARALREMKRNRWVQTHLAPQERWSCGCWWCRGWAKEQAVATLEELLPGATEVLNGASEAEWRQLGEWAERQLREVE